MCIRSFATNRDVKPQYNRLDETVQRTENLNSALEYEVESNGRTVRVDEFPADAIDLARCRPVYETLPGWGADLANVRRRADLPGGARRYVGRLEELLGRRVGIISVGPDREQTIRA